LTVTTVGGGRFAITSRLVGALALKPWFSIFGATRRLCVEFVVVLHLLFLLAAKAKLCPRTLDAVNTDLDTAISQVLL
jgi:hypothetical protein